VSRPASSPLSALVGKAFLPYLVSRDKIMEAPVPVTLTVTAKGQITLRKEVLEHLGVRPGDQVEVDLLPAGRVQARAKAGKPVSSVFGMLKGRTGRAMTIEQINEATAAGWSGER